MDVLASSELIRGWLQIATEVLPVSKKIYLGMIAVRPREDVYCVGPDLICFLIVACAVEGNGEASVAGEYVGMSCG
jgi:hypothetical protein